MGQRQSSLQNPPKDVYIVYLEFMFIDLDQMSDSLNRGAPPIWTKTAPAAILAKQTVAALACV